MGKKRKTKSQKLIGLRRIIKNNNLLVLNEGVELKKLTLDEIDELRQAIFTHAKNDKITWLKKGHGKRPPKSKHKKKQENEIVNLGSASFVCRSCGRDYEMEWSDIFDLQECTHGYVGFDTSQDYIACPYCDGQQKEDDYDYLFNDESDVQSSDTETHKEAKSEIDLNDSEDLPF